MRSEPKALDLEEEVIFFFGADEVGLSLELVSGPCDAGGPVCPGAPSIVCVDEMLS